MDANTITYSYLEGIQQIQKSVAAQRVFSILSKKRVPAFLRSCTLFFGFMSPFIWKADFSAAPRDAAHTGVSVLHAFWTALTVQIS